MKTLPQLPGKLCLSFVILRAVLLFFVMALPDASAAQPPYVEGELLVKFRGGPRGAAAVLARDRMNHEVKRNFDFIGWQQIRLPPGMTVEEELARYRNLPEVLAVEPNGIAEIPEPIVEPTPPPSDDVTPATIPNDPRFAEQYALAKIQATNAWDVSTGDSNVVVAIIDSGITYDHEDLTANMWRNPGEIPGNGIDDDGNGYVDDVYGIDTADDFYGNDSDPRDQGTPTFYHGTACAGVIGAIANNGLGIAGVNWNVQLMALRAAKTNNNLSGTDTLEAYGYVTLMKDRGVNIKVLSMSYGGTGFGQSHYDALAQITSRGILAVAAAANSTNDNDVRPYYPASYDIPGIVAVAATDEVDNLATFSNWGRTSVDLAAPGVRILMTGGPGTDAYRSGSGTSFSCPHVAGSAALLFATYPTATAEDVKAVLLETVDLIPTLTNRVVSHGRLNIARAIVYLNGPPQIYRQPQDQLAVLGHSATFAVGARGKSPLAYQWFFGPSPLADATNSTLMLTNITFAEAGDYTVVITNALGSITSRVAVLTVTPLLITSHPQDRRVRLTADTTFSVTAQSPEPPTYQWHFNDSPLPGGTSATLTVTNVQFDDQGLYTVVVSNSYTSVTSAPSRLSVLLGPAQVAYLKAFNTGAGDQLFSVVVSGDTVVVGAYGEDSGATGVNGDQSDNSVPNSGAVYVFVRDGDSWIQQAYLKASNTGTNDQFGVSVAISGDTIVVGAPLEDSAATGVNGNQNNNSMFNSGAAYVFVRDGTNWTQQAYLKASNTRAGDQFGAVAISGDTVVVGAWGEDSSAIGVNGNQSDNSAPDSGAAYVFVRNGTTWIQQAYLKASNTEEGDQFGARSVAVSGDTVVVNARFEDSSATGVNGNQSDNSATDSGAAYVFVRNGMTWSQQAYLKASNTGAGDDFGFYVAVSGATAVIAARLEDSAATGVNGNQSDNSAVDSGAAYVFIRDGSTWSQQAYLKASNAGASDFFGRSVAMSGDTVVVGAAREDSNATGVNGNGSNNSATDSGAAYVFVRNGTNWSQQAYLKASNTEANDTFGMELAISGDTVVVSSVFEDSSATGVNGDQSDNSATDSGAAYLFTDLGPDRPPLIVVQPRSQTVLLGSSPALHVEASGKNPLAYQWYFHSAQLLYATNAALVLNNITDDEEGAYTVVITNAFGSITSQVAVLTVEPLLITEHPRSQNVPLGSNVTLFVSAISPEPPAYQWLFNNSPIPGATSSSLTLTNVQLTNEGSYTVVVTNALGSVTSEVAVLTVTPLLITAHPQNQNVRLGSDATFSVTAQSPEPPAYQWRFEDSPLSGATSSSLTVTNVQFADEGLYTVVVSNSYTSVTSAPARLRVLIGPAQLAYLKASNTGAGDRFGGGSIGDRGAAVAVSGDTVVVGAYSEDSGATGVNGNQSDNSVPNSGAVYVFVRNGDTWTQQAYLKASNPGTNDDFGTAVAIWGDTIVVGASWEDSAATGVNGNQSDNSATNSGAAYVFVRNGTNWTQQAYLKASNTGGSSPGEFLGDQFGFPVAISRDTLVIGARGEDSNATGVNGNQNDNSARDSGAAYVFVRSGTNWTQQAYLKASNTEANDEFGFRVSASGETVVVAAHWEDSGATGVNGNQSDNSALQSGAAYVFVRDGTTWSQQAYLKASNTEAHDIFGISAAISGHTVVVGALFEDSSATGVNGDQNNNNALNSGAAYVYVRNGSTWSQQAYVKASNTGADDWFSRVALSDDTLVVGATFEDSSATGVNGDQNNNNRPNSGAAYVFVRSGTNWTQQAYLKASNTGAGDEFGVTVAVSGDTVVASALSEDSAATGVNGNQSDNSAADSGAAYVFTHLGPETPPVIALQPRSQTVLLGSSVTFYIEASGRNPLAYQWFFNSAELLDATDSTLVLNNVGSGNNGNYSVVVTNAFGSTTSQVAVLTVTPLYLTAHPQSQNVPVTSNVTFSVSAMSLEPPAYQWFFNNSPISGATSSSLTVTNVQLTNDGLYAVVVSNSYTSVTSNPARLAVLIRPVIVQPPLSQTVVAGGNVTLSVAITGNPPPFGFQWRRLATPLATVVQNERECFFTLSNVQTNQGGLHRVIVTNAAAPTFVIFASFTITVLADSDTNGLPDVWQTTYGVTDPFADPDNDFLTNLQEYQAGTDPTNGLSSLRLDTVAFNGHDTVLEFAAVSNKTYTVEYSDSLATASWHKLHDVVARTNNRIERMIDIAALPANQRFYRLITPRKSD